MKDQDNLPRLKRGYTCAKLIALAMCSLIGASAELPGATKPNIVFYLVDDLGWKDLGAYGGRFAETPVADKLAESGMRFTQAYAAPVCSPTRASLLTGQVPARHGVWEVVTVVDRPHAKMKSPPKRLKLAEGTVTFADILNEAGYVCGSFGKWHVGRTAQDHGFVPVINAPREPELRDYVKNNSFNNLGRTTAESIDFIRANKDRPFFLKVAHHMVHAPLKARKDLIEKYHNKMRQTGVLDIHPAYAAMVEMADESLGLIMNELRRQGVLENTIIVYYSDNGGLVSDMYLNEPTPLVGSVAPLRDQKGSLYEGGIRVPLIVSWPGKTKPGSESAELAEAIDLFPTFVEMGGGTVSKDQVVDGISLVPLLTGKTQSLGRDTFYWHFPTSQWTRNPHGAIRKGSYKLIEHLDDGRLELYDLSVDPGETTNLVGAMSAKARELAAELGQWRETVGAPMPTPNPDFDPARAHAVPIRITAEAGPAKPATK